MYDISYIALPDNHIMILYEQYLDIINSLS